jgi:glycerophosphoryl diester phosphodiesterase
MKLSRVAAVLAASACTLVLTPGAGAMTHDSNRAAHAGGGAAPPLVVGHRGSPGYLPEHTLESYKLAIDQGADYIEPDLVATKDGKLVARHDPNIGATTDVATKFPESRKRTRIVDGASITDWFVADFTLKELKTLRAVQPMPERSHEFDGKFSIPTFREVLRLAKREGRKRGRPVGVYPETKSPTYHNQLGLPLERKLVQALKRAGLNHRNSPIILQSFEPSSLQKLNKLTPVKLIQLVDAWDVNLDGSLQYAETSLRPYDWTVSGDPTLMNRTYGYLTTNAGLDDIAKYADGVSPWKPYIIPTLGTDANGDGKADDVTGDRKVDERDRHLAPPTSLVRRAHLRGLEVHTWTFRREAKQLAADYGDTSSVEAERAALINELKRFYALGVDGVFSDFPDIAAAARDECRAG